MEAILQYIHILADNSLTLFALMFLISLANTVFPPIPAEMGALFAGYLVAEGHGTLMVIIVASTLGGTAGNILVYYLARKYGMPLLKREPFRAVFRNGLYIRSVAWFKRYGTGALYLAKYVPGMHFCAVVAAGILRLRALKAVPGFLGSNAVSFAMLAVTGYFVQSHWRKAYAALAGISTLVAVAIILVIVFIVLARRKHNHKQSPPHDLP